MGLTYDALFPGRFIKAGEMAGKPATLTIADVYLDHIEGEDGREKPQAVVAFRETKREWALNKTNGQCLRALFTDDVEKWLGRQVTLYPERDSSGMSDSGVCLRVLGAPHLTKPLEVQIKLPRRKPIKRILKPTGNGTVDLESGEVFDAGEEAPAEVFEPPPPEEENELDLVLGNVEPLHKAPPPITHQQLNKIAALRKAVNLYEAEWLSMLDGYRASAAGELTRADAELVIKALEERAQ